MLNEDPHGSRERLIGKTSVPMGQREKERKRSARGMIMHSSGRVIFGSDWEKNLIMSFSLIFLN
jgi:hypothetical protein